MLVWIAFAGLVLTVACQGASAPAAVGPGIGTGAPSTVGSIALTLRQRLLLQLSDGSRRELVAYETAGLFPTYPRWSPDGRQLAFVLKQQFRPDGDWGDDIYVIDVKRGKPRLVRQHAEAGRQVAGLAWTPDGQGLLFGEAPGRMEDILHTGAWRILRRDLTSHHETVVLEDAREPSLSSDGTWMAYLHSGGEQDAVGVAHVDGSAARDVVPAAAASNIRFPRISDDGSSVAFTANTPPQAARAQPVQGLLAMLVEALQPAVAEAHGLPADVWTVTVSSGAVARLTTLAADDPCPVWTPGGDVVAVAGGGLYAIAADGSHLERIGDGDLLAQVDVR